MDFFRKPPDFLNDALPQGARDSWTIIAIGLVVLAVLLLLGLVTLLFRRGKKAPSIQEQNLEERLSTYPPIKPSTGDRRLLAEGVPVRIRLLVIASTGKASDFDVDNLAPLLEEVLPGLGDIYLADKPRVRVWPPQVSYDGFARHFHRMTIVPEGEGKQSPWVCLGGRVRVKKSQVMLAMALQALKPTTVGRRTLDSHEWASTLRVRVRD
ncbi:MAG: hypothetical protein K2X38_05335 [Gemmataceae bacterium]|nr:hypothetical protein [Gemmataceae bacterium]